MQQRLVAEALGGALVVRASGKFDAEDGKRLLALVAASPAETLVLNLQAVDYISSTGISTLIKLATERRARIACPSDVVRTVIDIAGLRPILAMYDTEAQALAARDEGAGR